MKNHLVSPRKKRSSGVALFVVMSALAILSIIVAELSYSTHMQSRLAYNHIDGLKAYYSAKAGYKIGLLRLLLYKQVQEILGKKENSAIAQVVGPSLIEKIWSFPFFYPIPLPEDASIIQKDALKEFEKEASIEGNFQVTLKSLGSKLNINRLLINTPDPTPSPTPRAGATPTPSNPQTNPGAAGATTEIDFKPVAEELLNREFNSRREIDREFAEQYPSVTGRDIIQAIMIYMKPKPNEPLRPNLPGANDIIPKDAPLYSISELHLIEGIDETLYDMIEPHFTAFSAPGVNINMIGKDTLWGIIPELTEEDLVQILEIRDHPETGALFTSVDKFWEAVGKTSVNSKISTVKERLTKAGVKLVTDEKTFHLIVKAQSGLALRTIEAYLSLDSTRQNQPVTPNTNGQQPTPNQTQPTQANNQQNTQQSSSAQNASAINLLYWHLH